MPKRRKVKKVDKSNIDGFIKTSLGFSPPPHTSHPYCVWARYHNSRDCDLILLTPSPFEESQVHLTIFVKGEMVANRMVHYLDVIDKLKTAFPQIGFS